jgi:hypothetical protein
MLIQFRQWLLDFFKIPRAEPTPAFVRISDRHIEK